MYENALSEPGNRKKHGAGENENHQHAVLRKGYFFCKLYYSHPHHFSLFLILFFRFLLDAIIMHLVSVIINARSSKIIGFHFISDSNVLENYTRPNCSLRVPTSFQGEELSCTTMCSIVAAAVDKTFRLFIHQWLLLNHTYQETNSSHQIEKRNKYNEVLESFQLRNQLQNRYM